MDIEKTEVVIEGTSWQNQLPELDDLEVLVAPWENAKFEKAMQKGIKALPPALRAGGDVDPAAYNRVLGRAIARTILFGWKNFKSAGADVPFSAEVAETYLVNPKYKPFRDGIVVAARRAQAGLAEEEAEIVGNSPSASTGNGTGAPTPNG